MADLAEGYQPKNRKPAFQLVWGAGFVKASEVFGLDRSAQTSPRSGTEVAELQHKDTLERFLIAMRSYDMIYLTVK